MSISPLVSIIINNYNYGHYLERAIQSALEQTYDKVEVIVVDDGSTDNSREIINKYIPKVISVLKENGGQASACNAGFEQSHGEIIFFLDADDYLYPYAVEKVMNLWEPGVAKTHFRLNKIDNNENIIGLIPSPKRKLSEGDTWKEVFQCGNDLSPPTTGNAFSRTALQEIMPIPELEHANSADAYLLRRAPFYGTFKAINQALGIYRIHGSNFSLGITHDNYGEMRQRLLHALDALPFYEKEAHKRNITFHPDFIFKNLILLRYRILSKRIAPEKHLFQEDTTGKLLWMTIKNCMLHKRYGYARKIYELIITLWVFLRPLNKIKTFPKN